MGVDVAMAPYRGSITSLQVNGVLSKEFKTKVWGPPGICFELSTVQYRIGSSVSNL